VDSLAHKRYNEMGLVAWSSASRGQFDLQYMFTLLSRALTREALEAVLNNPKDPFPVTYDLV